MKKAYTVTPEQYREDRKELNEIEYRHGNWDRENGRYWLREDTSDRLKKRYEKLTREMEETPVPKNRLFFSNTDLYNLWLNRDTDEPITARELYNIVEGIGRAIGDAESSARSSAIWSDYHGN